MATTPKKKLLNTLLAVTDHLSGQYQALVTDYGKFFKLHQGAFKGERKTYLAKPDTIDEPSARGVKLVVTTVAEKLEYLEQHSSDYINALFTQEATNASGKAKAELVVDGKSFGHFSSLELLRLKSFLDSGNLKAVYENIPVRNDDEIWSAVSDDSAYQNRDGIFATEVVKGVRKSTLKEDYILPDPNVEKNPDLKYTPVTSNKSTIIELGDFSIQRFSGEWSHRQRAELLARRDKLITAVIEALKTANEVEAVESDLNATKLFNYLHHNKLPSGV